jgi:hypothetical protein
VPAHARPSLSGSPHPAPASRGLPRPFAQPPGTRPLGASRLIALTDNPESPPPRPRRCAPRVLRSERVIMSRPSPPLRPDAPVSSAPADFATPRRLYRRSLPGGSAPSGRRDLPCFDCPSLFDCRPVPRRETARLPPPSSFSERIGHRAFPRRLASPFPQPALSTRPGLLVGIPHDAISSPWLRPSKLLAPPCLTDRDAHRHRAAGTCTPELAPKAVACPKSRV